VETSFGFEEPRSLAYSPDGQTLAAGLNNSVVLLDVPTRRMIVQHRTIVADVMAFSPDGKVLAFRDGATIRSKDLATWTWLAPLESSVFPRSMVFSPDGKLLASGHPGGNAYLWDRSSGKARYQFSGDSVAFSPDGKLLAVGGGGSAITFWEVATGDEHPMAGGLPQIAASDQFLPDGRTLLFHSAKAVYFWDTATGKELRRLKIGVEKGTLNFVALSTDGTRLVARSDSGDCFAWEVATGRLLQQVRLRGPGDFQRLASGKAFPQVQEFSRYHVPTALSPDGNVVALTLPESDSDESSIRLREAATGKLLGQFRVKARDPLLTFSPDGKQLASAVHSQVGIWDIANSRELRRFDTVSQDVTAITYSPDGRTLVLGSAQTTVSLWEVATGQERHRLPGHLGAVVSLSVSPDGRRLASSSKDMTALVWDLTTPLREEDHQAGRVGEPNSLVSLWQDLASADARRAYRAVRAFAASPQAVAFLGARLVTPPADPALIARWVRELDNPRFSDRQAATEALLKLGDEAEPALREALAGKPSLEVRRRIEQMLVETGRAGLRRLRAIEALEGLGTAEARQLLATLARARLAGPAAREARESLERLAKQPVVKP
jgi:WD40 repeat protein